MTNVKVYVDDVLICTMPAKKIENMLLHLRRKGIRNVTIGEA